MTSTVKKQKTGKWKAIVDTHINGERFNKSKTFELKHEAVEWRLEIERRLRNARQQTKQSPSMDITELLYDQKIYARQLEEYASKLPPSKKREKNRLLNLLKQSDENTHPFFFYKQPRNITVYDVERFFNFRSETVKGETIRKELTQLGLVYSSYGRDFESDNPFKKARRPKPSRPRTQRIKKPMEKKLLHFFKMNTKKIAHRVVIVIAIETAMRAGEIFSITWNQVDFVRRTIYLNKTKNGEERTVPLTRRAVRYLKVWSKIQKQQKPDDNLVSSHVFGMTRDGYLTTWHKCLTKLKAQDNEFSDLHFHDLRHEATSRFFEKGLATVEVQIITGHKTLSMLNRYTHLDALNLISKIG
jgi:integrase